MRSANLGVELDRADPEPLFRQIARQLERAILEGELPAGARLAPERDLARSLDVNRSTVVAAYRDLKSRGLLLGHVGRGTSVLPVERPMPGIPWAEYAREVGAAGTDPLIRDLLELTERRDVISLSLGAPAPELLPLAEASEALGRLLAERGPEVLLHSPTEGVTALREALCEYLAGRGVRCGPAELMVLAGSQQGLDLLARVLLAPGDAVVVEEPSYLGALQVFRRAGVRLLGVPVDGDGMRTDLLESLLERRRPKLIYTLPTFQNPSGVVMSLARRRHLLELSHRHLVPILEDDSYAELRYEGEPLPPLRALDARGHVVYLGSFSKLLFPGLRVGWLAAPPDLVRQLTLARQTVDLHTNTLGQWLVERFLREGLLARHLAAVRPEYERRRDALLAALRLCATPGLEWAKPAGGFYVWCRLPPGLAEARLLAEAAREGVAVLPGQVCFPGEAERGHVRLTFTSLSAEAIREGVARLARAVAAVAPGSARQPQAEGTHPVV